MATGGAAPPTDVHGASPRDDFSVPLDFGQPPAEPADRYATPGPREPHAAPAEDQASQPSAAPDFAADSDIPDAASEAEVQLPPPPTDDPWADYPVEGSAENTQAAEVATPPSGDVPLADVPLADNAHQPADDVVEPPAKLPPDAGSSGPIKQATFDDKKSADSSDATALETQRPKLPDDTKSRPWLPLVAAVVLLGCSLGGNIYLAWIAWDARNRYRNTVAKLRGAAA